MIHREGIHTQCIAFAAPVLAGKTQTDRSAMQSVNDGERKADHASSRQRHGINREAVWIQQTPAGDAAVVYLRGGPAAWGYVSELRLLGVETHALGSASHDVKNGATFRRT
jgi:hypothetical protein